VTALPSRSKIKLATLRLRATRPHLPDSVSPLENRLTILMTMRVTTTDRLAILDMVLNHLESAIPTSVSVRALDASESQFRDPVASTFKERSLPVHLDHIALPMSQSYRKLLAECGTKYAYFQFDDQILVNLSDTFLHAACDLLDRYAGKVSVVSPSWPVAVDINHERRVVDVSAHQRRVDRRGRERFDFRTPRAQRPVRVDSIRGLRFGIFENFLYGFYFNNVVVPVDDYAERLDWYMNNLRTTSVHDIEVAAAARTLGPFWRHIAICLDNVCLLDLDFSHTSETRRAHMSKARAAFDALHNGYQIVANNSTVGK